MPDSLIRRLVFAALFALIPIFAFSQTSRSFFLTSGEASIHVKTFGDSTSTPLMLINGGPGFSSEGFVPLARELAASYYVILHDQRGTGQSAFSELKQRYFTMDKMVADMEAIREHLKLDQWVLMGQSFGGMLAYHYAATYPDRVSAMIQSSSGGMNLEFHKTTGARISKRLSSEQRDSLAWWQRKRSAGDESYSTRLGVGRNLAPAYVVDTQFIPAIAERLTQGNMNINGLVHNAMIDIQFDVTNAMKGFNKPVLIIHGADDIIDPQIARKAHTILPNSKLVILENSRHYGWLDRRETYLSEIRAFMAKQADS